MFYEQYVVVTEAVVAFATEIIVDVGLHGGGSMSYREFGNTKPPKFSGVKDLIVSMI